MYRAFNLQPFVWNTETTWHAEGQKLEEDTSKTIKKGLSEFIERGEVNGSKLQNHWFPKIPASVFISHAHADKDRALNLAGWLKSKFQITSFIDSVVWGHLDDLLYKFDDKWCWSDDKKTFSYELRNKSTSHVHMMLATALSQMMDATECIIFVSSPNSVTVEESVKKLHSPWIYHELNMVHLLRKRDPEDHRPMIKESKLAKSFEFSRKESISIFYEADFSSLTNLTHKALGAWANEWSANKKHFDHPLDALYKIAPHVSKN
ncbi:hypothetical protein [Prosthecobacter vanneervenii]|uniref:TIR domain-containing protein n=1 Tax=Prosthecobacter vanneervenii TaxID=48466 RepID=A0A7W7YGV8_9BACT|nr:hypothetical protein [Prosthecobacter vanneervenii]MBB5035757.1 hypothetical protein [Prosthecobacter vanneervenii]